MQTAVCLASFHFSLALTHSRLAQLLAGGQQIAPASPCPLHPPRSRCAGWGPLSPLQLAAAVSTTLQLPLLFVDLRRLSRLAMVSECFLATTASGWHPLRPQCCKHACCREKDNGLSGFPPCRWGWPAAPS